MASLVVGRRVEQAVRRQGPSMSRSIGAARPLRSKTNFKLPVGYYVPKEGGIGWFDGLAVVKDAPNVDGAHAFINWMVDPNFYVEWATKVGAPASANPKANGGLPDSDPSSRALQRPGGDQTPAIHGAAERRGEAGLLRSLDRSEDGVRGVMDRPGAGS